MEENNKVNKSGDLHIRCTPEEHELFTKAASLDDRSLSSWVRNRLMKIAKQEIKESGAD